jgi:hypothetical protein
MKLTLKTNVQHDNRDYVPGDVIDVADDAAQQLLDVEAAEVAPDDAVVTPVAKAAKKKPA